MENDMPTIGQITTSPVITPDQLFDHWQGHRRLSRKMIEIFPEEEFYHFSIAGMRTYAQLTMEMIDLAAPGIHGIATGNWRPYGDSGQNQHTSAPATKQEVIDLWDSVTEQMNLFWPLITPHRFQENDVAFGLYEAPIYGTILYFIDNEIHHRGQGYVYLRALGIEPPAFWDRN